jgi:HTH-type transcriptional regulator/antitoxin HigA
MNIAPIKTQRDYRRVLKEIEGLMVAKRNTPEGDRLDVLVTLVERGSASIIRSTCRTRWRRSNITWTRMGFPRATSSP